MVSQRGNGVLWRKHYVKQSYGCLKMFMNIKTDTFFPWAFTRF